MVKSQNYQFYRKEEKWSTEQTMRELLTTTKTSLFPVAKLFKRELFQDFIFNTDYHLAEDALFLTEFLLKTKCTSVFIDKPIYYYDHSQGVQQLLSIIMYLIP